MPTYSKSVFDIFLVVVILSGFISGTIMLLFSYDYLTIWNKNKNQYSIYKLISCFLLGCSDIYLAIIYILTSNGNINPMGILTTGVYIRPILPLLMMLPIVLGITMRREHGS